MVNEGHDIAESESDAECILRADDIHRESILKKAIWSLSEMNGIARVEILDDKILSDLETEEGSVKISGGMDYENRALNECLEKDNMLCLFCNGFLEEQTEISMIMADDFDNVTGNNVPECLADEYHSRKDVIWLSNNFVLYPYVEQRSESRVIIMPVKFHSLSHIPEIKNAISFYPSVTSDIMLKRYFMTDYDNKMCTLIVGFDIEDYHS